MHATATYKLWAFTRGICNQGDLDRWAVDLDNTDLGSLLTSPAKMPWLSVAMTRGVLKAAVQHWATDPNVAQELNIAP